MGGKSAGDKGLKAVAATQQKLGEDQAAQGREYLEFSKKQYADNQKFVRQVLDVQLPAMRESLQAGREDRARYLTHFAPLETKFADDAAAYDTPARREAEAGRATADVATAAEQNRQNAALQLESYGIDPSMTRSMAIDRQVGVANAATEAAAGNQARIGVEERGRNLEQAAINIGRGYPAQSMAATGQAIGAGQAAVGTQLAPQGQMNQGAGVATNMFGSAGNALSGAAGTYNSINAIANQTPWLDVAAAVGGAAAGAYAGHHAGGGPATDPNPVPVGIPVEPDTVPTILGRHEFVIPSDVVVRKGTEFFQKMIDKTRDDVGIPLHARGRSMMARDLVGPPKTKVSAPGASANPQ
jgi:hypothetical protein